jgi:uncharacterized protein (DUF4415 family)
LNALSDDQIDTREIPEHVAESQAAFIGLFYPSGKKSVTIRLDSDVVDWFRAQGPGWQTRINRILRLYFAGHQRADKANKR